MNKLFFIFVISLLAGACAGQAFKHLTGNTGIAVQDTCVVKEWQEKWVLDSILFYKEYYNKFQADNTSDYQLLTISTPSMMPLVILFT